VQCGMGRTGRLLAHEWAGVAPDIAAVAKALGGGFPVGACLALERAASGMTVGSHGTTFGGNPLAMAVANAVLDVMLEEGFFEHIVEMGEKLSARLDRLVKDHPKVVEGDIRGTGLMLGMRCIPPNRDLVVALREAGLLAGPAGDNVLRLLPPLIVGEAEIDEAVGILDSVFAGFDS
ncbi:MAG: aminotransferase class III-fold pyridoxal phosphate-dependent enzyme, partial [Alphaproteobacteria bacterium]